MVARNPVSVSLSDDAGGVLHCYSFFAKSPTGLFCGFVVARNGQDAEVRAHRKARERDGCLVKLAEFSDCELETLQANGVWGQNPLDWLSCDEIKIIAKSSVTRIDTRLATKLVQVNRLASLVDKLPIPKE